MEKRPQTGEKSSKNAFQIAKYPDFPRGRRVPALAPPSAGVHGLHWFFFISLSSTDRNDTLQPARLQVIVINEDLEEVIYESMDKHTSWKMSFHYLPSGVNRVVIKGFRSDFGRSGFSIDGIAVDQCDLISQYMYCDVTCSSFNCSTEYTLIKSLLCS